MQLSEVIHAAHDALKGNKLRTGLTMLGIIIGISSVILITSIGQGAVVFITEELSSFGTNYFQITPGQGVLGSIAGSTNPLTIEDVEAIEDKSGIGNIESIAAFTLLSSTVEANDEEDEIVVYGLNPDSEILLDPEMIYGEYISEIQDENRETVAIIGTEVAEDFFGPDTNPVGETLRINAGRYKIIGVTQSSGGFIGGMLNDSIGVPLNTFTSRISGDDSLVEIDISVENEALLNQTMNDVEAFLRDRRNLDEGDENDFTIISFKESLEIVQTVTNLLTLMVAGISGISLIVGGVGVMNIMLVTVTERTKQIGLLKAIGAKRKDILVQFLVESITLSVVGGIIGIAIGIGGTLLVSIVASIPFVVSPLSIILAVGVSTLVGIIFGLYPASRAAKLNPIDALRHE